jgi:arginase
MGCGPAALIGRGFADELRDDCVAERVEVHLPPGFHTEASALVELQRAGSIAARAAIGRGARPIFLSGNCGPAALSATAALGPESTGVLWFDAHADFNTPDTSPSGFLDGMGLAILTGRCWRRLAERFDGFGPVPEQNVIQVGVRDLDRDERELLKSTRITRIAAQEMARLPEALQGVARRTTQLYVHLDADVLDLSEGSANSYARAGGLTAVTLYQALDLIRNTARIGAASIASYDPAFDEDGRIARVMNGTVRFLAG